MAGKSVPRLPIQRKRISVLNRYLLAILADLPIRVGIATVGFCPPGLEDAGKVFVEAEEMRAEDLAAFMQEQVTMCHEGDMDAEVRRVVVGMGGGQEMERSFELPKAVRLR